MNLNSCSIIGSSMFYVGHNFFWLDSKKMCRSFYILESIKYHELVSQNSKHLFVKPSTYDSHVEFSTTHSKLFFWITSLTVITESNQKKWKKWKNSTTISIILEQRGDHEKLYLIHYNTHLAILCPTQMVKKTLEESLKYDEELETKVMVLKVKVGSL